ncbi:aminopeptidase [Streptomyces sp. RPA4-5]|uniref:S28 family serine protease n=1 Tax=unclassified Streptomyces TaxID=2593676 RepID=UPI00143E4948|nr:MULTISPECIES: S28 family serine protease [unclassified Streptomyces]QIY57754.1 aminopeptidase [Streptomyces sp. RPA4-5]WJY40876.1 S28 family serine protease [Streptomyces sp. P9-2B-2]
MKITRQLCLPLLLTGLLASAVAAPSTATARTGGAHPATAPPATMRPAADDIRARLAAVPGMRVVKENPAPAGYRSFALTYRQPVDHRHPGRGTFAQRLTLLHRSAARPMVLHTNGYDLNYQTSDYRAEPTEILDGNQISTEQRYFGTSRPRPVDWTKLDIRQAAADHHRLVQALKPLYPARWISTGASKGGMATVYHRRFYPHDVAGSVAYAAPNNTDDRHDSAVDRFLARRGTPACRAALTAVQREILGSRRAEMAGRLSRWAAREGQTFRTIGSADRVLELTVLQLPMLFWMRDGEAGCDGIPRPAAEGDALYSWFAEAVQLPGYADRHLLPVTASFYQLGTQLGFVELAAPQLAGKLRHPGIQTMRTYVPRTIPLRFQPGAMPDIDRWVRHHGSELSFVYGANDPARAEPFRTGKGSRDAHIYLAPHTSHVVKIADLAPRDRARATAALRRWAGVDSPPAS